MADIWWQANVWDAEGVVRGKPFALSAASGKQCANFKWSVRMYLSMPKSKAPSVQVLSTATNIVTRRSTGDRIFEQLLVVNHQARIYNFDQVVTEIRKLQGKKQV